MARTIRIVRKKRIKTVQLDEKRAISTLNPHLRQDFYDDYMDENK